MSRSWSRIRSVLRGVLRRAEVEAEVNEEFRFHLDRRAEDLVRLGLPPDEARRRARLEFGSVERYREEGLEARGLRHLDELRRDVRHVARVLLSRDRAFALAVLLTLGVCIGANVAIYSVVEGVLLRPLPFDDADRLVTLYNAYPALGADRLANSIPDYFVRRERVSGLESVALYREAGVNVRVGDRVERVPVLRVTPSFFATLGVEASLGRTLLEEELEPGSASVVILTHGYWREHFGGSADVVGRTLEIDGQAATVVGVLPERFRMPSHGDARLVRPLQIGSWERTLDRWHSNNNDHMVARLASGATVAGVRLEIAAVNALLAEEWRPGGKRVLEDAGFRTVVVDMHGDLVRNVRSALLLLWGAVVFVLLIGCVNVANLMLARSEGRVHELATRLALGAGRVRLARQMMTEALLLGAAGGAVGLGIGAAGLRLLAVLGVDRLPRGAEIGLETPVLLYAVVLALGASLLIGAASTVQLFRHDLGCAFSRQGRARTGNRRAVRVRSALASAQVALAFLLLAGAGLMLRSFGAALAVDPGFELDGVLTGYTALTGAVYPDEDARRRFYDAWLSEVRALPGVQAAGVTTQLPFGPDEGSGGIVPEGYERTPGEQVVSSRLTVASPGYFAALGVEVLEGRAFEERDGPGRPAAIVIDEWLARRYWPDSSPIGHRMTRTGNLYTVIGVVESIEHADLTAAASDHVGAFYFTYRQLPTDDMAVVVRTAGAPAPYAPTLRSALDRVDPEIPLFDVRTLEDRLSDSLATRRTALILLLAFAGVAVFLAAVGTYGVLAHSVAQRTREIGIRLAVGGRPNDILAMVLEQGLVMAAAGLAAGAGCAFFLVRSIRSLIFGVHPLDPAVLLAAAALLALAALLACLIPARRATRVDPVAALAVS